MVTEVRKAVGEQVGEVLRQRRRPPATQAQAPPCLVAPIGVVLPGCRQGWRLVPHSGKREVLLGRGDPVRHDHQPGEQHLGHRAQGHLCPVRPAADDAGAVCRPVDEQLLHVVPQTLAHQVGGTGGIDQRPAGRVGAVVTGGDVGELTRVVLREPCLGAQPVIQDHRARQLVPELRAVLVHHRADVQARSVHRIGEGRYLDGESRRGFADVVRSREPAEQPSTVGLPAGQVFADQPLRGGSQPVVPEEPGDIGRVVEMAPQRQPVLRLTLVRCRLGPHARRGARRLGTGFDSSRAHLEPPRAPTSALHRQTCAVVPDRSPDHARRASIRVVRPSIE